MADDSLLEPNPRTVDGALERLKARDAQQIPEEVPEEVPEENEDEIEPVDEVEAADEEAPDIEEPDEEIEAEEPLDEPEEVEPEEAGNLPALDAPDGWTPSERQIWGTLTHEAQQAIIRRDDVREVGVRNQLAQLDQERNVVQQQRTALEAQGTEILKVRDDLKTRLEAQIASADSLLPDIRLIEPDSETYDPDEYQRQRHRHDLAKIEQSRKQKELDEIKAQEVRETDEAKRAEIQRNEQVLASRFPEWAADPTKGREEIAKIRAFISSDRFQITPQVAASVFDADMLTIARDAMKYNELMAKQRARKGTKPAPKKPPKTVKTTKAPQAPPARKQNVAAQKAHKEEGTLDSAYAALQARRNTQRRSV